ncbi:Toxin A (plasmid) [Bacillus cereus]|nr:Toxin A [Bacillus cereus]
MNNKNGESLIGNATTIKFGIDENLKSEIRFHEKSNNEVHNWLRNWHPNKLNERQIYDGVRFEYDGKEQEFTRAYDSSGNLIKNSWVKGDEGYSYASSSGIFLKGWQEVEGNTYYFASWYRTALIDGDNTKIDEKRYYFDSSGALQRSAWKRENGGLNYYDEFGVLVGDGLRAIDGEIYYFNGSSATTGTKKLEDQQVILQFSDKGMLERATNLNGAELTTPKTVTLDGKQIAFEKDGSIRKPGLTGKRAFPQPDGTEKNAIHYYSLEDGTNYTGWKTIDSKKYHLEDGAKYIFGSYQEIGGKRYYFNQDGEAKLTGFEQNNGKIYHYDDKGVMQTGWQEIEGKWYYFKDSGEATIGWFQGPYETSIHGYGYFWYYGKVDGSIYQNVTVQLYNNNGEEKDYTFDSHGHKK